MEMVDGVNLARLKVPVSHEVELPDAELVTRVRSGDENAFEDLFNRHRLMVAKIASRFFCQPEQIEEIIQESFTKVYFALDTFSETKEGTFAGWLARISFNCCYDELRRMRRRPDTAMNAISPEEAAWLGNYLRYEQAESNIEAATIARDLALKLCARLDPEDRFVLVMLEVEGMSVSEIAETIKWSRSKVKIRAFRARASLRRVLKRFL